MFSGKFPCEIYSQVTSKVRGDRVKILGLERAGDVDAGVDVSGFLEGGVAGMFASMAAVSLITALLEKERSRAALENPRNLHE